jgi:uncharacterized protein (TIGR03086 family)
MDPLAQLRQATAVFDQRLAAVTPDQWGSPTPCTEWTVRDLVDHVTGGNRWTVAVLGGLTAGEAFEVALAPGFGDDVLGDYRSSAAAQIEAFSEEGALDRNCHHIVGDMTGAVFIGLRTADLAVHAWDLARATGGDEDLGDELVTALWETNRHRAEAIAAGGMFGTGASGTVADDAPVQARLLDLVGRRP